MTREEQDLLASAIRRAVEVTKNESPMPEHKHTRLHVFIGVLTFHARMSEAECREIAEWLAGRGEEASQ